MASKIRYIIFTFLAVLSVSASAQDSQVMYYMKIPQNHLINPAIEPANSFYIGLPVLTGINVSINNNFLQLTDLFSKGDTISSWPPKNFDLNKLAGDLKANNNISADANIQLLGLGFMIGRDMNIFIDVIDRINANIVFPKDIMKLYITGYNQFLNQTINLSGLNLRAQYFREYGVGFSKNVTEKLRVGAKVKILFGIASLNFDNRSLSLKDSSFTQTVNADASLDVSGKERINTLDNDFSSKKYGQFFKDYLNAPFSNPGLGIDLGVVYNFNKMFSVSAAVTDLGFINWKNGLKSFEANKPFKLDTLSLKDVVHQTISIDSLINGIKGTIKNNFIENLNPAAYKTYLPVGISAGANINLRFLSFGVLSQSRIFAGQINEALTLSANAYLGRAFSASLGYTMANYSYNNFGFGIAFKAGPGQIYLIADKIPVNWSKLKSGNKTDGYSTLPLPDNWNMINLRIGFNISFGKIISKKTDKPMVVVE
jgi:Family of unknown function (DUF5723)